MTNINKEHNFLLGDLRVSPSRNRLTLGVRQVTLQPKVMAVLHYLALHQDRVVSGEELMAELWQGRIVTQGSVQKSINSLRKAFGELLGDQELIAHYSKRGYQLRVVPVFLDEVPLEEQEPAVVRRWQGWALMGSLGVAFLALGLLYWLKPEVESPLQPPKVHQTRFHAVSQYTNDPAYERDAEPHPDGRHVVYVREEQGEGDLWRVESQLLIRNARGEDWQIAASQGTWVALAWSPSGRQLAAIELWRQEGLPSTPGFYEAPNFLYTFHVFTFDLDNNRLLEKHLLSQWMGSIQSLTWWDDQTLEFVASQGPGSSQERYRYVIETQALAQVESPRGFGTPLLSSVRSGHTVLASQQRQGIRIDLLDERQASRASWQLDYPGLDISWIPDGSGVLAYAESQQKLFALYWDGQMRELPLSLDRDRHRSRPRYRPDGQALYLTEEWPRTPIDWLSREGAVQQISSQQDSQYAASFSPDGASLAYVSLQENQFHLWLRTPRAVRQLGSRPLVELPGPLVWSDDGRQLVYKLGRKILFRSLEDDGENSLRLESNDMEPLAYEPAAGRLWVIRTRGEARNLWVINPESLQQKQLTFGSLGAVLVRNGQAYFQYRGKPGLWLLSEGETQPRMLVDNLEENIQLLAIDDQAIYYVSGGQCRESGIYSLELDGGERRVYLARDKRLLTTHSFHPDAGALQQPCRLPDANILMLGS